MSSGKSDTGIREAVRERYASEARRVQTLRGSACCHSSCCSRSVGLYDTEQLQAIPKAASMASLGCGNPVLLAELRVGEVVLDLGSGGGIDVLLSAERVGPTGKVYGLDMTDEMLDLARDNARSVGATNVEFLKGHIESIPLPDASLDVIISNCVINLSPDKDAVMGEAYRVLKPGGRLAVADIMVQGGVLPPQVREIASLWADCVAGALPEREYREKLAAAGFVSVDVVVLQEYGLDDKLRETPCCSSPDLRLDPDVRVVSAFVKAVKPMSEVISPS